MISLNVGMIGYGFMGKAHSFGFNNLPLIYGPEYRVNRKVICGRNEAEVRRAADQFGWEEWATDWRQVVARPDIDVIDVSTPGDTHAEIAIAAAEAGKHILCEKPLANTVADAKRMLDAVNRCGVKHMVGFNYRRVPAISLARQLVTEGKVGHVHHWRATWLSDWPMPADFPLVWRLQKDRAGSGALGDIGAHIMDLSYYLVGPLQAVAGTWRTFRDERPLENDPSRTGCVTVDDGAAFVGEFESGAIGTFEATRFASGNKDRFTWEVNGDRGALRFNYSEPNKVDYYSWDDPAHASGWKAIYLGNSSQPYSWWPNVLPVGYGDTFVNELYEFVKALREDRSPDPGFEHGVYIQAVVEAVERSIASRCWVDVADSLR